ncbi:MAG: helix-turn-helix domain-containing protein [Sciscionella sp.]
MPTPTVRRLQLGNELRHLRRRAGVDNLEEAGRIIERSAAVMSRLEHGETGLRNRDLRDLVEYFTARIEARGDGGEPVDLDWYMELNRGAEQRGRWTGYRSQYPKYFRVAVDLEADASMINSYQTEVIHGLLQTEEYMRALFTDAKARAADQTTDNLIKSRLERQQVLTRPDAPVITIIQSESCIRRMVGNHKIMRNQLRYLADMALLPNVHLHVAQFEARASGGVSFPFAWFRVPAANPTTPPLEFVYVETYTAGDYLDGLDDVQIYSGLWGEMLGAALDPVESRDFLLRTAEWFL